MAGLDLRSVAVALGGEITGRQVVAPGPNHGRQDRSLSVRLSPSSPMGFIVHSFADDPFDVCKDYVAQRLGLDLDGWRTRGQTATPRPAPVSTTPEVRTEPDHERRIERAAAIWHEARDPRGTLVEVYLRSRGLELSPGIEAAIRFHARCPWRDEVENRTTYVPAMIGAMRNIETDSIAAVHRTRLTPDGAKVGRRMLGIAAGTAVKIDADDAVTGGLTIGEGIETVLAARQLGFNPAWATTSAGAVASFPLLGGVECLTLLQENDPTSDRAINQAAERWHRAGREVTIITPNIGSDMNDALRGVSA